MNAYEDIHRVATSGTMTEAELLFLLDIFRDEVRAATFREAARLLEATGRDDDAVNLLDNMASAHEPGGTAAVPVPAATSTHQHTPRERHLLLAKAIREQGGEWTTRRARNTYRALGINGLFRSTLRRDLAELHRDGHLVLHDQDPGRRYYTPAGGDC